jgi:hypothetical protein
VPGLRARYVAPAGTSPWFGPGPGPCVSALFEEDVADVRRHGHARLQHVAAAGLALALSPTLRISLFSNRAAWLLPQMKSTLPATSVL